MIDASLDPDKIVRTIEILVRRIDERFPDAGLVKVGGQLLAIGRRAKERADWISRPIMPLRVGVGAALVFIIFIILWTLATGVRGLPVPLPLTDFLALLDAMINDLIFVGAAVFFFFTLENRIKRNRALEALHELRAIAHLIDMHQLTKDPERVLHRGELTASTPRIDKTSFELSRYLDYCSEMLSLTGKVGAIYIQNFDDAVVLDSVSEVEMLTTGLSRKIWQKLMILHTLESRRV